MQCRRRRHLLLVQVVDLLLFPSSLPPSALLFPPTASAGCNTDADTNPIDPVSLHFSIIIIIITFFFTDSSDDSLVFGFVFVFIPHVGISVH